MPTSDEPTAPNPLPTNEHEWISYEEAIARVWQALPEFKDNGEAARGALIRALENGKVRCRDLDGREMRPDDVRDAPLSRVNMIPLVIQGGIKATRWWGVRDAFVAVRPTSDPPARKHPAKGIVGDFWPYVLGRCLARLARDGMPAKQKDLENMLASLIEDAEGTAAPSTIRRYAVGIRDGWDSEKVD